MKTIFVCIKDLKHSKFFKLPSFDNEWRSSVSKANYKVVGKLLTKFKCIDIYTGEIIYLPFNTYVKLFYSYG